MVKAYYVNDTALEASVNSVLENQATNHALLALRLNTSTLLHSRLHWRPETLKEIQVSVKPLTL